MPTACILGFAGPRLDARERALIRDAKPFGAILFARNIENPEQVRALVGEFRLLVGRDDAPVLIDQEGGRVARLQPPHWPRFPPAAEFGRIYAGSREAGLEAVRLGAALIASELLALGINVNCMPVADLRHPEGHDVIGDRAYSDDPDAVADLAGAAAEALLAAGVLPVVKHVPGHGRAGADSHVTLPRVEAGLGELERSDFQPFRRLAHLPAAMTAHVAYSAIDPKYPATVSAKVIGEVVRDRIGFSGLLITDDLSMGALTGGVGERTRAAFAAGCDLALHCNGDLVEMQEVVEASPELAGEAAKRAAAALARVRKPRESVDLSEARSRFSAMIAAE